MSKTKRRNHSRNKPGPKKSKFKGFSNLGATRSVPSSDGSVQSNDESNSESHSESASSLNIQIQPKSGADTGLENSVANKDQRVDDSQNGQNSNDRKKDDAGNTKPLNTLPTETFNTLKVPAKKADDSKSYNTLQSRHHHHNPNSSAASTLGTQSPLVGPSSGHFHPKSHVHHHSLLNASNTFSAQPSRPPPSNPKRPPYIRQISGFNDGLFPNSSPLVNPTVPATNNKSFTSLSSLQHSPILGASTPNSLLLDDDSASTYTNYGAAGLTTLPRHGKLKPKMTSYWAYYIPALEWIPRYKRKDLFGDICAGLTLASFQIPVSMSYANSLARVPMVCGLYGLVIGPLIYGLMGTTPYMVVGPEAALSLVVGQSVLPYLDSKSITPAHVSGIMSGACGAVLLGAGLLRFGYLDSVLSRALLRGFISAVGFVMVVDQLASELKLEALLHKNIGHHATTWDKMVFLIQNASQAHRLTAIVAFTTIFIIVVFRIFKVKMSRVFKQIIFVPEILIVVIVSTVLTGCLNLDDRGLDVVGKIPSGHIGFHVPFTHTRWAVFKSTFSSSFVCAVLGFFESTIAAKSLGATANVSVSTNRELVALGVTNIVGSMVNALPSFGGYGRSKINMLSGARTHLASFVLAATTAFCIAFAMRYFYYLPKCILSAIISVIGLSLIEEAPRDIMFYWKIGGYEDLFTMCLTLICTIFWSLEAGIAIGVGFSLVRVVRHSTKSRIQILGRVPGTNTFENADGISPEHLEEIDGCLICKIPEPLFFANTGDLRNRLRRLEVYGSMKVHPSFPRLRDEEMTRSVIFDLHGMTKCDPSAMQILMEIVSSYVVDRKIPVLFTRVPQSKTIRDMFKLSGVDELVTKPSLERYFKTIDEALRHIDQQGLNYQNQRPSSINRV